MAQDIRKLIKEQAPDSPSLPKGHEARFQERLEQEMGSTDVISIERRNGSNRLWLRIAAIAVIVVITGVFGYIYISDEDQNQIVETDVKKENVNNQLTLGDLSPDLKKIEDYYKTGINVQLASLKITKDNKALIDGYMGQLKELNDEYKVLNAELNNNGPSEATITALIDNLKLRLELLFKLKNKLKELKNQKDEKINPIKT
jgi:predicted negative regulator of RcsB-dependent stress response